MFRVHLASPVDFAGWRRAARSLALARTPPEKVVWTVQGEDEELFAGAPPVYADIGAFCVSRRFLQLAETSICHKDPERFSLLYSLLLGTLEERRLLDVVIDPLVARVGQMAKGIRRDIHKMHAFVRFRAVATDEGEHFIAGFEPEHHIVEAAAPFFQRRFASMRWSILTPDRCAHWDGEALCFTVGVSKEAAPSQDALEDLWRSYYSSIFNPARLKVAAMQSEMPRKYWKNLPEAQLIRPLIEGAERRSREMVEAEASLPNPQPQRAEPPIRSGTIDMPTGAPGTPLGQLKLEAEGCRACPLWAPATQTVFGEGPENAHVVFVGEQPGDNEDLQGRPFVGPAGKLFDRAMEEARIDRTKVYVTNAVKHFKFEPRGKRRIHAKPNSGEIKACRPWLTQELQTIHPKLVVALGATAVQSLIGKATSLRSVRGEMLKVDGGIDMLATVHPSYLLRVPDEALQAKEYAQFVLDLRHVGELDPGVQLR